VIAPGDDAAAAFLAFLTGAETQRILTDHGFGLP
jgi:ABC-type glycerol-3-phosphate transport system substrate-binding protein